MPSAEITVVWEVGVSGNILSHTRGRRDENNSKTLVFGPSPLKLGPGDLGTLSGGSGVKFRIGLHPPERSGDLNPTSVLSQKLSFFGRCWLVSGWAIVLLNTFPLP